MRNKVSLFSIRNKIYICFIIPIICMIIVGFTSYSKAADGMSKKFTETSAQTVNMAVEYMDQVCANIQTVATGYSADSDYALYILGMPGQDERAKSTYYSNARLNLMATQMSNKFINNIHLIPKSLSQNITTALSDKTTGFFDEYKEELANMDGVDGNTLRWITTHPYIDEAFKLNPADTLISYQVTDTKGFSYVIVDINKKEFGSLLSNIDFGPGSYVGIVTSDGKEVAAQSGVEELMDQANVFVNEAFYQDALNSESIDSVATVQYKGDEYLFISQKSELTGIMICALIPETTIIGQAESIKILTIVLVIIASIVAIVIGSFIATGIQKNMKNISKKLDEVAKGNLTVNVEAYGRDEFQGLAQSATNMVSNNKNLVVRLNGTAKDLEDSARNVDNASGVISTYASQITEAIDEISQGMDRQAAHATECVDITNSLSEKISVIIDKIGMMEKLIGETEQLVGDGTNIVRTLNERTEKTSVLTEETAVSIDRLKCEADSITDFVNTIKAIANKTNLLSLNASIEAARAGEMGKGFAVVAEEIRSLADSSKDATVEIDNKIQNIGMQTAESVTAVENANEMVGLSHDASKDVNEVFASIREQMYKLKEALEEISECATEADVERRSTVDSVDNISEIIKQTAGNSSVVRDVAEGLMNSVDRLGETANMLDDNMNGLKHEIQSFTVE